jgi:hypothetical protein
MLLTILSKINVSIVMPEKPGILSILPLSATRFCQVRVGKGCQSQFFLWQIFWTQYLSVHLPGKPLIQT